MKRYALAFPIPFFRQSENQVVLIQKAKPEWQKGKLNLVGGHVEDGENYVATAVRELEEETGLEAEVHESRVCGFISGEGYEIAVVRCPYHDLFQVPQTRTGEKVFSFPAQKAIQLPNLIPNLKVVIPLMLVGVEDWRILGNESDKAETSWTVECA
jgi:8-oxo-dGTP diphosphatase